MDDVKATLEKIMAQQIPVELSFDGQSPSCTGRLTGTRRVQDAEGLVVEVVSGDAPRAASVVRGRAVVDRVLYEFGALITRRLSDPLPVFVVRYPTEIHQVERRVHHRVEPGAQARLRVALTMTGGWLPAEIHNLSEGGAAFSSPHVASLAVGHAVARLELTFDDHGPIMTSGTVRNVYTIRYPREVGPVFGVQWGRLTPDEASRLAAFVLRSRTQSG
jgi:hypothetical protein